MNPPKIKGINLNHEKACIISRRAELLWSSPAWWPNGVVGPEHWRYLGFGWHEFILSDDLPLVLAGFADPHPGKVQFRCMCANVGSYALFTHIKFPLGENWLTIGNSFEIPVLLPSMPCDVFLEDENEKVG